METYAFPGMFKKFLASLTLLKYEPLHFQFTLMNFYSDSFCSQEEVMHHSVPLRWLWIDGAIHMSTGCSIILHL